MNFLKDLDVASKRILVRCDFNVPLNDDGSVAQDFKIRQTLPTIRYLLKQRSKIILLSHLGEGKDAPNLDVIKKSIEELLGMSIKKSDNCVGSGVEDDVLKLGEREILLLENVRFHEGEMQNDVAFAKELSHLADVYINDAFAVCHRNHASVALLPQFLPHGAGLLLQKELEDLERVMHNPARPMLAMVGGKKVGTKAAFIEKISAVADDVIVSGLIQQEMNQKNMVLSAAHNILAPQDDLGAPDISAASLAIFKEKILSAKTIFWNGPFGKFEEKKYAKGTRAIADAILESQAFCVVGGGETVAFLIQENLVDKFKHVSTGGGAMLAYIAGEILPGLEALNKHV